MTVLDTIHAYLCDWSSFKGMGRAQFAVQLLISNTHVYESMAWLLVALVAFKLFQGII